MKRIGNIWAKCVDKATIRTAIVNAAKGKKKYRKVRKVLANLDKSVDLLHDMLVEGAFVPSPYVTSIIKTEYGKEREIFKLPFFPDRGIQHDISLCLRPRWTKAMTSDTYACIVGRGINCNTARYNLNRKVKRVLNMNRYRGVRLYCLKMDIRKCYPSVDNEVLARLNRKYCKDPKMLELLDLLNFNDGCKGLPIGNFLSQLWINVVLTELDRYVKEVLKVRHYFRYMDDIVFISDEKSILHQWQWRVMNFVWYELHMEFNQKRQVFPIGTNKYERGIDYAGYVFRREPGDRKCAVRVRKRIKQSFAKKRHQEASVPSYIGIIQHCDGINLVKTIMEGRDRERQRNQGNKNMNINDIGIKIEREFEGDRIKIDQLVDRKVDVLNFRIKPSKQKPGTECLELQVRFEGKKRFVMGNYTFLIQFLREIDRKYLPLEECVIRNKRGYYFDGTIDEE